MAMIDMWQPVQRRARGARISAPTFASPSTEALGALRGRAGALQRTIDDPLSAPGVGGSITALNTQLARQAQAARGQAMGRATGSGQGGFAGAMAQSGASIEGAFGDARYQGQSQLVGDVLKSTQEELSNNLNARGGLETQLNAQQVDQTRILADVENQNAQLDRDYFNSEQSADMQDAQRKLDYDRLVNQQQQYETGLAARAREFDLGRGDQNRQFDQGRGDRTREFDLTREDAQAREQRLDIERRQAYDQRNREFDLGREDEQRALAEQRARDARLAAERRGERQTEQERYTLGRADQERDYRDQREERASTRDNRREAQQFQREEARRNQQRFMSEANRQYQLDNERSNEQTRSRSQQSYGPVEDIYGQMGVPRFRPGSHFNRGDPKFKRTQGGSY